MEQSGRAQLMAQLKDFLKKAQKLGKYPVNTAKSMIRPLHIVERGLSDEEPSDLDYIAEHLEEIFHRQINVLNLSQESLEVYVTRLRRLFNDFKTHGSDTKAFHAWKGKITRRVAKSGATQSNQADECRIPSMASAYTQIVGSQKNAYLRTLTWALRTDLLIQIQLPSDMNANDVVRLKKLIDLDAELTSSQEERPQ